MKQSTEVMTMKHETLHVSSTTSRTWTITPTVSIGTNYILPLVLKDRQHPEEAMGGVPLSPSTESIWHLQSDRK